MSGYRSHSKEAVQEALFAGVEVWSLDTGSDGEDDTLFGTKEEVVGDILDHFDIEEFPPHWSLEIMMPHNIKKLYEIIAFRCGYRHGKEEGQVSPREAEDILNSLPISVSTTMDMVTCFCEGAEDGAKGDSYRYILSYNYL